MHTIENSVFPMKPLFIFCSPTLFSFFTYIFSVNIVIYYRIFAFYLWLHVCTKIGVFLYWLPVPPTITEAPQDTTVNEGDPLQLTCKASGKPTPTITWTKDDNPLGKPPNIQKSDRTDAGKYVCRADNNVKEAKTASAQVTVQCKFD